MAGVLARTSVVVACLVGIAVYPRPASPTASSAASLYSGSAFDACSAPALTSLQAWQASPYRAVGIYLGGINRACPDGNLSTAWTSAAVAGGWNLLPLYVGLQAPCVAQPGLALINPSSAAAQGAAAADDAVARAGTFGIAPGAPIYFDMEGYKTDNGSCTQTVQAFLGAWVGELRSRGYLAGVYGSAASTIRDLIPLAAGPSSPDAVWIANWNDQTSVFGDRYVPDTYWPNHQRVHQYHGGHNETYGRVTINIDSNVVDGPVAGPGNVAAPPPAPTPQPQAGSLATSDGQATVAWPQGALPAGTVVSATSASLSANVDGFAAGSYVVQVTAQNADGSAVSRFGAPISVALRTLPPGTVPGLSTDGTSWRALALRTGGALPAAANADYTRAADGSLTVWTRVPGSVGLLRDIAPPTTPSVLTGRFVRGSLRLSWRSSTDNGGLIANYAITLNGTPLASVAGSPGASVRAFYPHAASNYRVVAQDSAGNVSAPSTALVVRPAPRPAGLPAPIPDWAYQLAAWQQNRVGRRPAAPRAVPAWYWRWRAWRLQPFRVAGR
jgi:hypothetical protein